MSTVCQYSCKKIWMEQSLMTPCSRDIWYCDWVYWNYKRAGRMDVSSIGGLVGPQFLGTFPFALLIIRPLLVVSIMQFVPKEAWAGRWLAALVGGLFLTLFDMILDPVAVQQWLWMYTEAVWYWVPSSNFLGRILIGNSKLLVAIEAKPDYTMR